MHNDEPKRSAQLVATVALLLSGVVCGAAAAGTTVTANGIQLPDMKSPEVREEANSKNTAGQTGPTSLIVTDLPDDVSGETKGSAGYQIVVKTIREELRQGRPTYALKLLEADQMAKKLKNREYDRIIAQIAQSYLIEGKVDRAGEVAEKAVKRSGKSVPLAAWVAGQAAWRQGKYAHAMDMFGLCAKSDKSSPWLTSGGAYWAARAATRAEKTEDARQWLEVAARHPRTFYGIVSLRALGRDFDFNWDLPDMASSDHKHLKSDKSVQEALRLSQAGSITQAIQALASSVWMKNIDKRSALLAYIMQKRDPALSLYVGKQTRDKKGRFYDAALYPESPWEPHSGYEVDKALIHALIRQESRFIPSAVSRTGAKGLMQIMPTTANYIAASDSVALGNPKTNIEVGQKYVRHLLSDPVVNNDLLKMAVAYNAGPGNLARWKANLKHIDDPLLFIESIPSGETRAFVERVMVNYWIYRLRLGQDVPSLDAIVSLDNPGIFKTAQKIGADMVAMASGN